LQGDDALEAQNVRSLRLGDVLNPREEFRRVDFTSPERYRLHRHIVDRRGVIVVMVVMVAIRTAYMVMVVMVVMMMVIMRMVMITIMSMMVMIVIAVGAADVIRMIMIEEVRIVVQNALQVEGAAVQHAVERDGGALGAMDDGMRV